MNQLQVGRLVLYCVAEADEEILEASAWAQVGELIPASVAAVHTTEEISLDVHVDGLRDPVFVDHVRHGRRPGGWDWREPTQLTRTVSSGLMVR